MTLWPLLVYAVAVVAVVGGTLALSALLGERHTATATGDPYESGILPTGSGRLRFPVQFYLVAVFFVLFDLEAIFLFAWALVAREAGWPGFWEAMVFIAVLLAALLYLIRDGALDWRGTAPASARRGRPR